MAVRYKLCDSAGLFVRWLSKTEARKMESGGFIKNVSRWVHGKGKQDPVFMQLEGMWRDVDQTSCSLGKPEMLANVGIAGSMKFIRDTALKVKEWNRVGTPQWGFGRLALPPNESTPMAAHYAEELSSVQSLDAEMMVRP